MPGPTLVSERTSNPGAVTPLIRLPAKVAFTPLPPVVRTAGPLVVVTMLPAMPWSEPMLLLKPPRSSPVPAPATVMLTWEFVPNAVVDPAISTPPPIVVTPL